MNNNFIKVTMVFIREIHFSSLVQKLLRICVWLETDLWAVVAAAVTPPLAQCDVLCAPSIFTAQRYAVSEYAMVALCLSVFSSQVAAQPITVVCKAARVYMPILCGVV